MTTILSCGCSILFVLGFTVVGLIALQGMFEFFGFSGIF